MNQTDAKGFFGTLFDFEFKSFLTMKFLKIIYAVLLGALLLMGVLYLFFGLSQGGVFAVLTLLFVPVLTLIYVVLLRVGMEAVALFFRIGENTGKLVELAGGTPSTNGPLLRDTPAPQSASTAPPQVQQSSYSPQSSTQQPYAPQQSSQPSPSTQPPAGPQFPTPSE